MKNNAMFRFTFEFEVWTPVVDGQSVSYTKLRDDVGHVTKAGSGAVNLACEESLSLGAVVRNLRDDRGTSLQSVNDAAYDLFVNTAEPEFDGFSHVIGWRHTLRRSAPRDVVQAIKDAAASAAAGG